MPTILVVDDQAAVLGFVRLALTRAGYQVLSALDGESALKIVARSAEPIDLAILDVNLPDMSGPELLVQLRHLIPCLRAMFAAGDPTLITDEQVIAKPFDTRELFSAVDQALNQVRVRHA